MSNDLQVIFNPITGNLDVVDVTPDATSLVKGKIKLTGDLGGTADSPTVPGLALKLGFSFESVSKNLKSNAYALNYTAGKLTSIVYTIPSVGIITKTLNYSGSKLTSVVLSGSVPSGILLTKTLTYTGNALTSILYS